MMIGTVKQVYKLNGEYYDILDRVRIKLNNGEIILGSIIEIHNTKMHLYVGDIKGVNVKYEDMQELRKAEFTDDQFGYILQRVNKIE